MYIPTETGHWVSEEFMLLSEVIQDYDSNLELRWIPPENRTTENERKKPCMIWHRGQMVPIMYISEREDPAEIIARLFLGDQRHGDVLTKLDKLDAANQALEMRRQMELAEEAKDQVAWAVGTNKNYIKFNGKKFDDQFRELD